MWFKYPFSRDWILRGANFRIIGNNFAIVGSNGSGKTTLLRLMMGLEKPIKGNILFDESAATKIELRKLIFYIPVNVRNVLIGPTVVRELMRSMERNVGYVDEEVISETIEYADIKHLKDRKILFLSEGERRIVAILSAIVSGKKLIVLDEPTIGLDKRYRERLLNLIRENSSDRKFIVATNDMRFAVHFDEVALLHRGIIARQGSPREVFYNLESSYGETNYFSNQIIKFAILFKERFGEYLENPITVSELVRELTKVLGMCSDCH